MFSAISFDNVGNLDHGILRQLVDKGLAEIREDLWQRNRDNRPRELTVKIKLAPDQHNRVKIDAEVTTKLPTRCTATTVARMVHQEGGKTQLLFEDLAPDNPDQLTLDVAGGEVPNE